MTSQHDRLRGISVAGKNRRWLLDDFQVLQWDPAGFVGHVGDPGPAVLHSLYPNYLAFHHGHFSCNVALLGNRGITVYHDTILRDQPRFPFWLSQNTHPGHSSSLLVTIFSLSPASMTSVSGYFVSYPAATSAIFLESTFCK